jgi:hypothetical protein
MAFLYKKCYESWRFWLSESFKFRFTYSKSKLSIKKNGGLQETSPQRSVLTKLGYSEKKKMRANILVWKQVNREK